MSLPSVEVVRERISQVDDLAIRMFLTANYLFCARPGEILAYSLPGDSTYKKSKPRGSLLKLYETTYTPDLFNQKEMQTLMLVALVEGKETSIQELSKIKEPVAVFQVSTHKRLGMIREVALPLNPIYEPWTQPLVTYFKAQKDVAFPFNRQEMWRMARETFKGLKYKILAYRKTIGRELDGKPKKETKLEHMKPFSLQALRHLRASELRNNYNFDGADRSAYGGWTLRTTEGVSGSQDRYVMLPWHTYFPKLLKKR